LNGILFSYALINVARTAASKAASITRLAKNMLIGSIGGFW
jgi:hypothetical protein